MCHPVHVPTVLLWFGLLESVVFTWIDIQEQMQREKISNFAKGTESNVCDHHMWKREVMVNVWETESIVFWFVMGKCVWFPTSTIACVGHMATQPNPIFSVCMHVYVCLCMCVVHSLFNWVKGTFWPSVQERSHLVSHSCPVQSPPSTHTHTHKHACVQHKHRHTHTHTRVQLIHTDTQTRMCPAHTHTLKDTRVCT